MFKASRSNTPLATWTGMHKGRLILIFDAFVIASYIVYSVCTVATNEMAKQLNRCLYNCHK